MAYGTRQGLALIDIVQHICVLAMSSPDLYGAQDPYTRISRQNYQAEASATALEKQCSTDPEPSPMSPTPNASVPDRIDRLSEVSCAALATPAQFTAASAQNVDNAQITLVDIRTKIQSCSVGCSCLSEQLG